MNPFKVHIFCQKFEICSLIKKKLRADGYDVECTNITEAGNNFLDEFQKFADCIILDKDIDILLREKIRDHFEGIPIVCLPSLDTETSAGTDITYVSEPLKMSELSDIIKEIRTKKKIESNS